MTVSSQLIPVHALNAFVANCTILQVKPFKAGDKNINYGPYENIAAGTFQELSVHFETKTNFLTTLSLVREIEVSHWGNVAVTEDIAVKHTGAALKVLPHSHLSPS
jgi:oligosaccharyltransferase complex subunit alpha (ribophorin I)